MLRLSVCRLGGRRLLPCGVQRQTYSSEGKQSQLSSSIRALMRSSAQPVAVITTLLPPIHDAPTSVHAHGATLSSFTTVSLDPPLVAFSLQTPSRLADALVPPTTSPAHAASGAHFVVNVLSAGQTVEAAGFSKPGLTPFPLDSAWPGQSVPSGNHDDEKHPLFLAQFHASQHARDKRGVSVPVLSNSLGSLACSIVSRVALQHLDVVDAARTGGSDLFLARVHGVEGALEAAEKEEKLPMVYWDQQFKTVKR